MRSASPECEGREGFEGQVTAFGLPQIPHLVATGEERTPQRPSSRGCCIHFWKAKKGHAGGRLGAADTQEGALMHGPGQWGYGKASQQRVRRRTEKPDGREYFKEP